LGDFDFSSTQSISYMNLIENQNYFIKKVFLVKQTDTYHARLNSIWKNYIKTVNVIYNEWNIESVFIYSLFNDAFQ
jgi:predicted proteasome-type protease